MNHGLAGGSLGPLGHRHRCGRRSGPELPLLVLDLTSHKFKRAVLEVSDPDLIDALLAWGTSPGQDS